MPQPWITAIFMNAFALVILLILLIDSGNQQHRFLMKDQLLFKWMLILNILILAVDAATWVLNGKTFAGARTLNVLLTTVFYILDPVMSFLYICYCDLKIGTMPGRNKRLHMLYAAPLLINLVLALISVRSGWLFSIGLDNVYRRGSALAVSFLLSYVLLGVAFVRVLYYRKKLRAEAGGGPAGYRYGGTLALLLFPLSPLIGGLIQIANPPMTVVWLSTVFALLVLYISVQNAEIVTDPLTGLYNRRQTDSYLQGLIQGTPRAGGIRLAILDVDNFKQINDRYGHLTGDRALRTLASVLRSECARDTFCSRYGGDEFVIVTRHGGRDQLEALLARIDERLDECCGTLGEQFRLSISVGAAAWSAHTDTADTLFAAADKELYLNKRKLKRRATDQDEG